MILTQLGQSSISELGLFTLWLPDTLAEVRRESLAQSGSSLGVTLREGRASVRQYNRGGPHQLCSRVVVRVYALARSFYECIAKELRRRPVHEALAQVDGRGKDDGVEHTPNIGAAIVLVVNARRDFGEARLGHDGGGGMEGAHRGRTAELEET